MADDLNKKKEPEIIDATEKVEEIVKDDAKVVKAAEKKAEKSASAAKSAAAGATAAVTASAAKDAAKDAAKEAAKEAEAAAKEAEAAAKEAKKAEEQAAKDAAKQKAQAEKDAEKARIAKEKADAKALKKKQKREAQQALIDACPPQYRPVSTSKYFWLAFLSLIPCIGFIATLILSIAGRNRNVKNFEKAILAYYIIGFIICLIAVIIVGVALPADIRDKLLVSFSEMASSIQIG